MLLPKDICLSPGSKNGISANRVLPCPAQIQPALKFEKTSRWEGNPPLSQICVMRTFDVAGDRQNYSFALFRNAETSIPTPATMATIGIAQIYANVKCLRNAADYKKRANHGPKRLKCQAQGLPRHLPSKHENADIALEAGRKPIAPEDACGSHLDRRQRDKKFN